MSKRNIGIVIVILLVVALVMLYGPTMTDPDADKMPDDVTGPGQEGMIATGEPLETPDAGPEASPPPGETVIR